MRPAFVALVICISPWAAAQTNANLEQAFMQLAGETGVALLLEGVEEGASTVEFRTNAYFIVRDGAVYFEQWDYRGSAHTHRIVADGTQLFVHDVRMRQVEMQNYGTPRGRLNVLLQRLPLVVRGTSTQPATLLQAAHFMRPSQALKPWFSVGQPTEQIKGNTSIVSMRNGAQWMAFELSRKSVIDPYKLNMVRGGVDAGSRRMNWQMAVRPGFVPAEITFRYVPLPGVQVVASPTSAGSQTGQ